MSEQERNELFIELEASRFIHRQIAWLNGEEDVSRAIDEVLARVGEYLRADRAYIFQRDEGGTYSNTHEWCAPGVTSEIDTLQQLPAEGLTIWLDTLEEDRCVVIGDIGDVKETDPFVYETLARQEIRSVVEAPITISHQLSGFIGVDNAPRELTAVIAESLTVLGTFIGTVLRNQRERKQLQDNHSMQKEMVNGISCGVVTYAVPQKRIMSINSEARRIIGCGPAQDPEEAMRVFVNDCVMPEDRAKLTFAGLQKEGDKRSYRFSARMPDGSVLHLKAKARLLRSENGQLFILCSLMDLTEQTQLARSLEKERKSYRDALANGSEFTFFFDVTEGLIHEEFATAHGVNLVKRMGFTVPVSFDALLARYVERAGIRFMSEGMRRYFTCAGLLEAFDQGITNAMTEYYNPEGDLYIRTSCLLSRDGDTGHIHASIVATDITEAKRLESAQREALTEANAKLEKVNDEMSLRLDAIVNGISGGLKIAEVTDNYRYTYISEGAAALQGYTVPEFMEKYGRSVISNIYPEEGEAALAEANRQMEKGGSYTVKYRVPHRDGTSRWVIDRGKLVHDQITGKTYYYILMQDVTELEDRNRQLNDALSIQREIAGSLGSGILAYTIPERQLLLLNRETERMLACKGTIGSTLTTDIMSHVVDADRPSMRQATAQLRSPGDRVEYTFHYVDEEGAIHAYRCNTAMLCFDNGQRYILSSINDVTEMEEMEKRIAAERLQYRNALAFGSAAFFSIDLEPGILDEHIFARDGLNLTARLGLTLPATYGELMNAWFGNDRIVSDSAEIGVIQDRDAILERCRRGSTVTDFEYFVPGSGKYFHVMVLLANIGNRPRASFILYDITADRQEEQQRRTVIETLGKVYSCLYHISLRDHTYVAYKQNEDIGSDLPGRGEYTEFRRVYKSYVQAEHQAQIDAFMDPDTIRANLSAADYATIEYRRQNLGWVRLTAVAADRDENGVVESFVYAVSGIEEQKQLELSRQHAMEVAYEAANIASSAKSDFLANMSHDIRTPLNAIIGMTAIAGTHLDDRERVVDCLSKITVSSKHLLGLINEVLDMSKIESGKMELQDEEFVLPELLDNLLTMSRTGISTKNHTLSVSIHNIEHEQVIGDSQRIQQVFMNVMSNAIKYTPDGGRIRLTVTEKPTNRLKIGCYEFIFEDNGIGMSEEFTKHLFEPFARAKDDARVNSIQGTGLGMSITRNIIQMMNGTIQVQSKLNEGTKVTITIFLKLKSEEEMAVADKLIDLPVLVADDDAGSCEYACQLLDELGMRSESVLSGEEAVRKTLERHERQDDYFAVILDWKMPGMDGVETTREIRRRVGNDVPIVIISSYDWSDIELTARAAGANAFISKPLFRSRVLHLFDELTGSEKTENKDDSLNELSQEDYTGKRVLLVEDNELNAEIASEILGMAGLDVVLAENGKVAVDMMSAAQDHEYDIVFMDIQMPVMNGYEAARAIRALPRDYTKSVPIIALTANAFAEDVAAVKVAGMNEHMAKPIDFHKLLAVLRKWL